MIKNNFIITEEERQHILNLTRLPNYKKPVRLKEQYSAVISDTPPAPTSTGGGTTTSGSIGNTQTNASFDIGYEKQKLADLQKNGSFGDMDFNRNPDVVGIAYDRVRALIDNYYRGRVFGMFANALAIAGKIYPDKEYNGQSYTKMNETMTDKTAQKQTDVSSYSSRVQKLSTWNSLTNPTEDEVMLYNTKILGAPFESVTVYQLKDEYMSPIKLGTPTGSTSGNSQNDGKIGDKDGGVPEQQAKEGLLGFLKTSKNNVDSSLTDDLCIQVLQSYLNDIITGKTILTDDELRLTKTTIAHCNTNKIGELKTNIFGKVKNKTSGNAYSRLGRRFRKQLEALPTRPDKFKINLTDPYKN